MKSTMNIGVIGAGAISGIYLKNMSEMFPNLHPVSICANHIENAQAKAKNFGLKAYTLDEMLKDPEVDLCVVLTPVDQHYPIIKKVLLSGKHAYTEKTISESTLQAEELCNLADSMGLYLGSAPDTFLGAAIQTARKAMDDGLVGDVNSFSISINRSNDLLAALFPFLRLPGSGVLRDYMVYYLTALISVLGPAKRVAGCVREVYPERLNSIPGTKNYGEVIKTPNESVVTAMLELENGVTGTIHQNHETMKYDLAQFNIFGRKGVLCLSNPNLFGGEIKILKDIPGLKEDLEITPITTVLEPVNIYTNNSRGLGVSEMVASIMNGKKNRASKELAVHVLDILECIEESSRTGTFCDVKSSCTRPEVFTGF